LLNGNRAFRSKQPIIKPPCETDKAFPALNFALRKSPALFIGRGKGRVNDSCLHKIIHPPHPVFICSRIGVLKVGDELG
jgi:hypothetical protein